MKRLFVRPFGVTVTRLQARSFLAERRMRHTEEKADDPMYRLDAYAQNELYKKMLKSGKYDQLVSRFESQPQLGPVTSAYSSSQRDRDVKLIQKDMECLKTYVTALVKAGKHDRLALLLSQSVEKEEKPPQTHFSEGKEYIVRSKNMDTDELTSSLYSKRVNSQQQERNEPLHIIVSEAFSWSKILRKFGTSILTVLLVLSGASVLLDQQGIIRGGVTNVAPENQGKKIKVKFADVQGVDEAKHELEEVVEFLRNPQKFLKLGGKLPKGVLLYGPPGTGKTMLARAIAGEADVPFFHMSGSEFDEVYVGVGAKRVRELFQSARKSSPCIIFIDELDAVGSKRNAKDQSYMRQTLNQLLVELDGFSSSDGIIFIGATNAPDSLDKALTRPGRLDKLIPVSLPDVKGRVQILKVHSKQVKVGQDVKLDIIARGTPGFSGAALQNLVNQAAIRASHQGSQFVEMSHFEWAKDKIIMGAERKSAVISPENKKITAYHEGGHALVALYTEAAMPLHKVTVIPRGSALGVTVQLPEEDVLNRTKRQIFAMIDVCMGGLVAESLIGGPLEISTGASNDLQKATSLARGMVLHYGMNENFGLMSVEEMSHLSSDMQAKVDKEVKDILQSSFDRAVRLLKEKRKELDVLAQALIDYETLSSQEIQILLKGGKLGSVQ